MLSGRPPRIDVSNAIDGEQAAEDARDLYERLGALEGEREIDRRFTVDHPPILFHRGINHEYRFGTDIPIVIEYDAALRFWTFRVGQLEATFHPSPYGTISFRMFRDGAEAEEELFDMLLAKYDIRRLRHSPGMPIERAENPG